MCEETGSLIGVGGRPAFLWHEEPAELGEFIPLSAALDFVVAHDAYPFAGWGESDGIARFQANHAEAEAASLVAWFVGAGLGIVCAVCGGVGRVECGRVEAACFRRVGRPVSASGRAGRCWLAIRRLLALLTSRV